MDITGTEADLHMRTDANNLVTTASTTHLPEQKETIHMIQMLRKEAQSGRIHDLAHVSSEDCMSDCLTKQSASPDALIKAVVTGVLPNVDKHPPFREMLKDKHRAYSALALWCTQNVRHARGITRFLDLDISRTIQYLYSTTTCHSE